MKIDVLSNKLAFIQGLRGGMCDNHTWDESRDRLNELINSEYVYFLMKYSLKIESKVNLFRGRIINDKEINNIENLIYKPSEKVLEYGRCNIPKQSIYYASNNFDTVLSELSVEINDIVYVLNSEIKNDKKIDFIPVGELDHLRRYGKSLLSDNLEVVSKVKDIMTSIKKKDINNYYVQHLLDAYLSELFFKKAYTKKDYKLTSAFSDIIYKLDSSLDGISYPSVKHRGGINFAIKSETFDEKIKVLAVVKIKIINDLGFGIYTYEVLDKSKSIGLNGDINWS
jgi:hypothetical protein|tara:strand:- start:8373 stop:9221 length:849 start_codon:yes stop_codon:yes gene_type:complete